MALEKICRICRASKALESFWRSSANKDGLQRECKDCTRARLAERADARRQYAWEWTLRNKFNMTPEDYGSLLELQGGVCAICGEQEDGEQKLAVDHNHETGDVRGLLCKRCNMGIGLLRDRADIVRSALIYLEG